MVLKRLRMVQKKFHTAQKKKSAPHFVLAKQNQRTVALPPLLRADKKELFS